MAKKLRTRVCSSVLIPTERKRDHPKVWPSLSLSVAICCVDDDADGITTAKTDSGVVLV